MAVLGYKAFSKELKNNYHVPFQVGTLYICQGMIKFGTNGNGFHFCKNLEDTFRFVPAMEEEIMVAEVEGSGKILTRDDNYYGYYDMYVAERLRLLKLLSRQEIIQYGLSLHGSRVIRFLSTFLLQKEELNLFQKKYKTEETIIKTIGYYQEHQLDVYRNR